jgi:hypothetical protein
MQNTLSFSALLIAAMGSGVACSSSSPASSPCATASYDLVVAASDYTSSEVGLVSLAGASDFQGGIDLGADPTLSSSAGRYFWIARDLGQIIELDTTCLGTKAKFDALDSTPTGSTPKPTDPYDVAVAPDGSLWIARFDVPTVLVLNADGTRRMTVDLSFEDTVDGNPNMNSIRILDPATASAQPDAVGTITTAKAYVSLEILDDDNVVHPLISTRKSKLARIDLATGAVEDTLTLAGRNPLSLMVQVGNQLYLADAGTWCEQGMCPAGQPDAGVERVDTGSFTSKLVVTGTKLGGHASEVAVMSTCGVVIVAGELPETPTSLVQFDPNQDDVVEAMVIPTASTFTLAGLAWVDGALLVGDGGTSGAVPAIRVFDAMTTPGCSLTERAASVSLPLPPIGFAVLSP